MANPLGREANRQGELDWWLRQNFHSHIIDRLECRLFVVDGLDAGEVEVVAVWGDGDDDGLVVGGLGRDGAGFELVGHRLINRDVDCCFD